MIYTRTTHMPLPCSTQLQSSDKHSKINGDYTNCWFDFWGVCLRLFPSKDTNKFSRGLMPELSFLVWILEITSPRRVAFAMALSFNRNPFYSTHTHTHIYIYSSLIHSFRCVCGLQYIGRTNQYRDSRIKQHPLKYGKGTTLLTE